MSRPLPQSYLLRLWHEHPDVPVRATPIAVGQPEAHQHFADLEQLFAELRRLTDDTSDASGPAITTER